jgi:hypothetical protein
MGKLQSGSKLLAHHHFYLTRHVDHTKNRLFRAAHQNMPKSARIAAKAASKRPAPTPEPTANKKSTQKATKRVKQAKFQDPATLLQESKEPTPETEDDDAPAIVDVSNEVYTLSKHYMLGPEPVLEDTAFLTLGEFSYQDFSAQSMRKLGKMLDEHKFEPQWVSGQAVVSRRGLAKSEWLKFPVHDSTDWENVEKCMKLWMQQLKSEIKVKLTIVHKKVPLRHTVDLEDEEDEPGKVFNVKVTLILGSAWAHRKAVE